MVLPAQGPVKRAAAVEEAAAGRRRAAGPRAGTEETEERREAREEVEGENIPPTEPVRAVTEPMESAGYGRGS